MIEHLRHHLRLSALFGDGARYTLAACGLAVFDLAVAWTARTVLGVPLTGAAMAGVIVGGIAAYLVHEFWTFQGRDGRFSMGRLMAMLGLMALTLGLRGAVVATLDPLIATPLADGPILLTALLVTFLVNFGLNRWVIFSGEAPRLPDLPETPGSNEGTLRQT